MSKAPQSNTRIMHHNAELSLIFQQMASCYRYLGEEQRFRAIAYTRAARTMNNLKEDISYYAKDIQTLENLKTIGKSIAEKIIEYLKTGKIKIFEELKKKVPVELLELMDISGFGPATVKKLHDKLGINNQEDLIAAISTGRITREFGSKRIENLRRGLKLFKESQSRMPLRVAMQTGNSILEKIKSFPEIQRVSLAGSLRRRKETIGDIDIVATAERKNWKRIIRKFTSLQEVSRVLVSGETKASILLRNSNIQVDLRIVKDDEYGALLLYSTGPKEHSIALRILAKEKGWKLNEYGLFDIQTGERLAGESEDDIYRVLGLQYIPPELRENKGGINKIRKPRPVAC